MQISLFPLGNALFPDGVLHLRIFEVRYLDMIKKSIANHTEFGVLPLLAGREVRTPDGEETLAAAGTLARIDDWSAPMAGLMQIRCTGTRRFMLTNPQQGQFGLWTGDATLLNDDEPRDIPPHLQSTADALGKLIAELQQSRVPREQMPLAPPYRLDECGWVANRWSELLPLPASQKAGLLQILEPQERLEHIHATLSERGLLS